MCHQPLPNLGCSRDNGQDVLYTLRLPHPSAESSETVSYLVSCLFNDRIKSLALKRWRDEPSNMVSTFLQLQKSQQTSDRFQKLSRQLAIKERKEILSILECALWNLKVFQIGRESKKQSVQGIEIVDRCFCRVSCGADEVISNVLPYLEAVKTD